MDKLREEFEKQIREDLLFDDEELEWQPERNCYVIYGVHLAWWGYRASRENLVVDLPSEDDFVMDEAIDCLNECKSAIRSIGLSIKGE
ncbi:hypothetical protein [Serratia marcescens]|uniref:hypothetical protein n=1 Tax=Serratia marcescens TaxID=615 RepID=UPI001F14E128|nr:hypothetical protein [Serratia marcescens]MDP8626921.1 hypothetical protein [Serratia marcescens]MDP8676355.1 hypothetical protein [Serratia marcescens]MDP8691358.1 hypothetical protein [Serratia marcescens]MDP8701015.1 hypothetical protein [Serratia marcescens]MDP8710781.1 hypothetical protein [Serratia marcescens]